jgi:hypothetical protein
MELSWNTRSALVYMLADLVAGSDGVLLTDVRTSLAAQFETPSKALKAAKQIQSAILEFARHRPDSASAAAIVIHGESELIEGRDSAGAAAPGRSLLQYAKPAQILMTESVYGQLREMPGLRFKSVTPAGTSGSDLGIRGQELIWRTPETPARSAEAPPQATQLFVQKSEPPSVKVLPMPESILARPDYVEEALPDSARNELQAEPPIDLRAPALKRYLAIAAGVAVLSVLGMFAFHRKHVAVDPTSGVHQTPPEPANVTPETIPQPASAPASESSAPPLETDPLPKPKPPKVQPEKSGSKIVSDFSARDIPFLLRKAEQDAGAGRYDDARREYKIVLQLDPNNANAKLGLHRLELSR